MSVDIDVVQDVAEFGLLLSCSAPALDGVGLRASESPAAAVRA